jgi:hypothetical protein
VRVHVPDFHTLVYKHLGDVREELLIVVVLAVEVFFVVVAIAWPELIWPVIDKIQDDVWLGACLSKS